METDVRKHRRQLKNKSTTVRHHTRTLDNPNYNPKPRTPLKPNRRKMSFMEMEKRTKKLSPFTDIDGDGVKNKDDCHPLDSTRQDDPSEDRVKQFIDSLDKIVEENPEGFAVMSPEEEEEINEDDYDTVQIAPGLFESTREEEEDGRFGTGKEFVGGFKTEEEVVKEIERVMEEEGMDEDDAVEKIRQDNMDPEEKRQIEEWDKIIEAEAEEERRQNEDTINDPSTFQIGVDEEKIIDEYGRQNAQRPDYADNWSEKDMQADLMGGGYSEADADKIVKEIREREENGK